MAKFNNIKRIIVEDFPDDQQELVSKLGFVINNAFEQLVSALNKNITIGDNLNQNIINIDVVVGSTGKPTTKSQVRHSVKSLSGVQVIRAQNNTNLAIYPTGTPFITFTGLPNNLIEINNITGLQAGNNYTLTLLLLGN